VKSLKLTKQASQYETLVMSPPHSTLSRKGLASPGAPNWNGIALSMHIPLLQWMHKKEQHNNLSHNLMNENPRSGLITQTSYNFQPSKISCSFSDPFAFGACGPLQEL